MSCREWEHLLAEYVDGTLPPDERARVNAHLAACPACAAEVAAVQRLTPVLHTLPDAPPPHGLADAVFAKTTRRHGWLRRLLPRRLAPVSAAAVVLVLVVALATMYRNSEMADRLPSMDKGLFETAPQNAPVPADMPAASTATPKALANHDQGSAVDQTVAAAEADKYAEKKLIKPALSTGTVETESVGGTGRYGGSAGDADGFAAGAGGGGMTGLGAVATESEASEDRNAAGPPLPPPAATAPTRPDMARQEIADEEQSYRAQAPGETTARSRAAKRANERPSQQPAEPPAPMATGGVRYADVDDVLAESHAVPIIHRWEDRRCGVTKPRQVLVDAPDVWADLWGELNATRLGAPPAPYIDFSKQVVVGVFLGLKPTGGHAVRILDVRWADNMLLVVAHATEPAPGTAVTQALTQPYSVVIIPRMVEGQTITRATKMVVVWR